MLFVCVANGTLEKVVNNAYKGEPDKFEIYQERAFGTVYVITYCLFYIEAFLLGFSIINFINLISLRKSFISIYIKQMYLCMFLDWFQY